MQEVIAILSSCLRQCVKLSCFLSDIIYTFVDALCALWRKEKRETPFHALYAQYYGYQEKATKRNGTAL